MVRSARCISPKFNEFQITAFESIPLTVVYNVWCSYNAFKNSSIIHEQNTKEIIAAKESLFVMKHTWIFTKLLPQISQLIQHLH